MGKRKGIGQRSNIVIDEMDLDILKQLSYKGKRGILELAATLKVEHKTIQSHLKRLLDRGFITIKLLPQNKKEVEITDRGFHIHRSFRNLELFDKFFQKK